jgi:hypothetical protein
MANEQGDTEWNYRVATGENCITNGLEIAQGPSGALCILASNNDEKVRLLDPEACSKVSELPLGWAANCSSINPVNRCAL